jgi:lysophospholipase L1-like esterase
MAATYTQAGNAVGPGAQYVTLWSGTNDVCTPTTGGMTSVASFTQALQSTLSRLTTALPGVRILVLSIPDWYGFRQTFAGTPAAVTAWATYGRCADLLGAGATPAAQQAVATRIADLNNAIVSVCAQTGSCGTDGGAIFRLWPHLTASDLTFDYFHLSPAGEARVSAASWAAGLFVAPTNSGLPVVSGVAQQGQTLTTTNGSWTGSPSSFSYQWQDCDSSGANCSTISGASGQSYLLQAGDVGHTIRAAVTAHNSAGDSSPALSAATAPVTSASTTTNQFGNTTAGTVFVSPGQGYKFGSVFTLSQSARLVDFKWYVRGGASPQSFTPVIYSTDSTGKHANLVAVGSEVTIAAGAPAAWATASLPATTLAPGSYLLGLTSGPTSQGAANAKLASGTGYYNPNPYGSPTTTWGTVNTETATWSYYVDYT